MSTKINRMSDKPPTLEEAQAIVGGYVQLLELPDGRQMLVDEDGITKRKERNAEATAITKDHYLGSILGDALILEGTARWRD